MIDGVTGDPASCSQLGGALRSEAARLAAGHHAVSNALLSVTRDPSLVGAGERSARDLRLLDTITSELDAAGALLQQYAQELAQVSESARQLESAVARVGLQLDGLRVVEPWGVASTEAATHRQATQPELQMRADRLASRLGKSRAAVQRSLGQSSAALGRAAAAARGSLGA